MRPLRLKIFAPLLISAFMGVFSQGALATENDPTIGRSKAVEKMNEADFNQQSLRNKIISSRTLILYMQDILPNKGNPYYHMADFAAQSTKDAFNKAQKNNDPFMDDVKNPAWLPTTDQAGKIDPSVLKNVDQKAVIEYFAQYIATVDVMKTLIQPVLSQSIIVDSIEVSAGSEAKSKFDKAWKQIDFLANKFKTLLNSTKIVRPIVVEARRKSVLTISGAIVAGMQRHLSLVVTPKNQKELTHYLNQAEEISSESAADTNRQNIKTKVSKLHNKQSPQYQAASAAFGSVDLPDSGDIDGADQAFEIAMRLEVGFDLLKNLFSEISHW